MRGRRPTPPAAEGAAGSGVGGLPTLTGLSQGCGGVRGLPTLTALGQGPPHPRAAGQSEGRIQVWAPRTHAFLCDEYLFS